MVNPNIISNEVTNFVIKHAPEYRDNKEYIRYGLEWIISLTIQISVILILSVLFGVFIEATVSLFTGAFLRSFGGGAHFKSYLKCVVYSTILILILSIATKHFLALNMIAVLIIYLISMFIYNKKAPVLHKTRALFNDNKKMLFKHISLFFITTLFILTILLPIGKSSIISSIWLSVLFQSISLTKWHHDMTDWLDKKTTRKVDYL